MPVIAPPALVVGAPRVPLPYGLFSVLAQRGEAPAERWEAGGVMWETLTCEPIAGISAVDCDPAEMEGLPKSLDKLDAPTDEANTFTLYGHYTCSPIGNTLEYAYERAQEHLTRREESGVEDALWTGSLLNAPNFAGANEYPAPEDLGAVPLARSKEAVALLEQYIAVTYGSQGVMHMSRYVASILLKDGELEKRGGRLYTALDTPVVAGTGYGDEKIVVSAQLFGYRSDIFPGRTPNTDGSYLNRANNDLTALAERTYLVGFDSCGLASVTLTPPV